MVEVDRKFNEAGRRLKAALISYQLGKAGVDSTLKKMPDDPGAGWAELAEHLLREMADHAARTFNPVLVGGPKRVQ